MPAIPLTIHADSTLQQKPIWTTDGSRHLRIYHNLTVSGIVFDGRYEAEYAIRSYAPNPNEITITNCDFTSFIKDAITDNNNPVKKCVVRQCTFQDIGITAIEFHTQDMCYDLLVEDCTFYQVGEHAVKITEKNVPLRVQISNITVYGALGGVYFNKISHAELKNSIITHCSVYGVRALGVSQVSNICFYNNRLNLDHVENSPGSFEADPLFYDPQQGDFSLLPGSPCLQNGILGHTRWTGAASIRAGRLHTLYRVGTILGSSAIIFGVAFVFAGSVRLVVRRQEQKKIKSCASTK